MANFVNNSMSRVWPSRVAGVASGCSFGGDCCWRVGRQESDRRIVRERRFKNDQT